MYVGETIKLSLRQDVIFSHFLRKYKSMEYDLKLFIFKLRICFFMFFMLCMLHKQIGLGRDMLHKACH